MRQSAVKTTGLEVTEEARTYQQADAQARVILVIIQQALAIAVVILQHDELVGVVVDAIAQLHDGVEVEVPAFALDQCHVEHPLVIHADGLETGLVNAAVSENVAIVLAIDNGNPELGMRHQVGRDVGLARQRQLVPTARGGGVTSVGLMLQHDGHFAHEFVFHDDVPGNTHTRIEVQVMEGQGAFKHVPHRLLGIKQIQIGMEGQHALGEALLETDLELDIAVRRRGLTAQHGSGNKVSVLVQTEVRTLIQVCTDAVSYVFFRIIGDDLTLDRNTHSRQQCNKYQ